jgi:DNA helicase-2/ATP-dependent DNA helicase PcrA
VPGIRRHNKKNNQWMKKGKNMSIYDSLNPQQKKGVFTTQGPVLLLAGAGSGKTRVLTHRISYLIEEEGVNPWNILAITFTNKAAREMRERVDALVSYGAEDIWVSTFHSTCVRILRRHIELLGYKSGFTIYDTDDQKTVIKEVCRRLNIDTKQYPERSILSAISQAKNELKTPADYEEEHQYDFRQKKIAQAYREYQKRLKENNAMDFDDLLFKTVELFQFHPEILDKYQDRFRYIMVDEYQDTNTVQFKFVSMLARKYRNLCVVGDDDQSIYKFRGANIYNILNFEKEYPDAEVIKLEQNYRSTKRILAAANRVIAHNAGRKEKALWTENEEGEKISFSQYGNEYEEAEQIADKIENLEKDGASYQEMAILYRTNAQSRVLEEKLLLRNIPYKIVGGINFYQRKEIKDILSYLKVVDNGVDDLAVRRIINVPKRGIGAASIEKINIYAMENEISFFDAAVRADEIPTLGRGAGKIRDFTLMIGRLRKVLYEEGIVAVFQAILEETGYVQELQREGTDEAQTRIENIDELMNKLVEYEEQTEVPSLSELLEEIALVADIDGLEEDSEKVVLMTLHSAKGLEFPYVFLAGMEDGVFPSYMTIISEKEEDLEEERRLCYVGITRAKKRLYLSAAQRRMMRGQAQYNRVSRFIAEIPKDLLEMENPFDSKEEIRMSLSQAVGRRQMFHKKPYQQSKIPAPGKVELDYQEGDRVAHVKFGYGTVEKIQSGGRDYEVTVNFDKFGVKKMFASFAKLQKDSREE